MELDLMQNDIGGEGKRALEAVNRKSVNVECY
jgi:hypothetical protein